MNRQNLENINKNTDKPTWISPDKSKKSIIDFVLENKANKSKIENLSIDYDDIYRVESKNKRGISKTDHITFFFEIPWDVKIVKKEKIMINKQENDPDFKAINEEIETFTYDYEKNALSNYDEIHKVLIKGEKKLHKRVFVKTENRTSTEEQDLMTKRKDIINILKSQKTTIDII